MNKNFEYSIFFGIGLVVGVFITTTETKAFLMPGAMILEFCLMLLYVRALGFFSKDAAQMSMMTTRIRPFDVIASGRLKYLFNRYLRDMGIPASAFTASGYKVIFTDHAIPVVMGIDIVYIALTEDKSRIQAIPFDKIWFSDVIFLDRADMSDVEGQIAKWLLNTE